jgi:hypothetical protein
MRNAKKPEQEYSVEVNGKKMTKKEIYVMAISNPDAILHEKLLGYDEFEWPAMFYIDEHDLMKIINRMNWLMIIAMYTVSLTFFSLLCFGLGWAIVEIACISVAFVFYLYKRMRLFKRFYKKYERFYESLAPNHGLEVELKWI